MRTHSLVPLLAVLGTLSAGCSVEDQVEPQASGSDTEELRYSQDGCRASGGKVEVDFCCRASKSFPNTCGVGACGCSWSSSHAVYVCACPAGSCFNGTRCVSRAPAPTQSSASKACQQSGGTVTKSSCCLSSSDFPNTCRIGACGCSAEYSHPVNVCRCPTGKCWNGSGCVGS